MTDLTQLKKDRDNARETYLTQSRKRQKLEKKRPSAYDKYIGSKPESPQRVKLKKEYYDLLDDIADARKEENRLYGVFESLDNKVKGYKSKPSNQNVPNQHGQSNSPRLDNLNSGWSNKSDKTVREITTAPSGILPGLNFPNKGDRFPLCQKTYLQIQLRWLPANLCIRRWHLGPMNCRRWFAGTGGPRNQLRPCIRPWPTRLMCMSRGRRKPFNWPQKSTRHYRNRSPSVRNWYPTTRMT